LWKEASGWKSSFQKAPRCSVCRPAKWRQCTYEEGALVDPHVDDCVIGERGRAE
jgi:hypothetical protein